MFAASDPGLAPAAAAARVALSSDRASGLGASGRVGDGPGLLTLCQFRCGQVLLVRQPWVPPKAVCRALAAEYGGKASLLLNLEEEL